MKFACGYSILMMSFFVWLKGVRKLLQIMKKLNECNPSLTFTYEYTQTKINFLVVIVEIYSDHFIPRLFHQLASVPTL